MSVYDVLKPIMVPLHREGYRFFVPLAIVSAVLLLLWAPLGVVSCLASAWCYFFFRDPDRVPPRRSDAVVAPADGVICAVVREAPPEEIGLDSGCAYWRISVFMSVFDCHVNRAPVSGEIEEAVYRPGRFLNASLNKASEENERNSLRIRTPWGHSIGLVQVAGLVARRIVCYPSVGARLVRTERYGIIRFGSRVDVYLPDVGYELFAVEGQRSVGGETILATFAHAPDLGQRGALGGVAGPDHFPVAPPEGILAHESIPFATARPSVRG